jgi:hypothetical protein
MAKELPYFRFTVQEWQNGDITLEGIEAQGVFINACCYYWLSDCSVTLEKLKKRLNTLDSIVDRLVEVEIIKHDEKTDFISIKFLDEQFDMLSDMRKKRQKAGKKGGKQKSSNAKAKGKQSSSYKDKDKDKDKDKYKVLPILDVFETAFKKFWDIYPLRNGKKVGKKSAKELFFKQKESDLERITKNAENYGIGNEFPKDPERFLKNDFWMDWDEPQSNGTTGINPGKMDYYKAEKVDPSELPTDEEKRDLLKITNNQRV